LHCDEPVRGLVDAAQQETLALGERAEASRKRAIEGGRNYEKRASQIAVAQFVDIRDPTRIGPNFL